MKGLGLLHPLSKGEIKPFPEGHIIPPYTTQQKEPRIFILMNSYIQFMVKN